MDAIPPTPTPLASPFASDDDAGWAARPSAVDAQATAATHPLRGTRRPVKALLRYYMIQAVATGPGLIVMLPLRYFRYHTLRYLFDDEGVTVRWGILFRREISLTYARIQDIHLVSNIIERWFGLGRVQIQTASGHAGAEMTIEGLPDYERVRDELYRRMRGARSGNAVAAGLPADDAMLHAAAPRTAAIPAGGAAPGLAEAAAALQDAVAELRAIRGLLEEERR